MAMRLSRQLYDTTTKTFSHSDMRGQLLARLPVGRCDCGGWVDLLDMSPPHKRGPWSLSLLCRSCSAQAAAFGMPTDLDGQAAEDVEPVLVPLAAVQLDLGLDVDSGRCRRCMGALAGGRRRAYCGALCRQRAYRERRAAVRPASVPVQRAGRTPVAA